MCCLSYLYHDHSHWNNHLLVAPDPLGGASFPTNSGTFVNHQALSSLRQLYGADGSVSALRLCQPIGEVHFTQHIPAFRYSECRFEQLHPRAVVFDFHKSWTSEMNIKVVFIVFLFMVPSSLSICSFHAWFKGKSSPNKYTPQGWVGVFHVFFKKWNL